MQQKYSNLFNLSLSEVVQSHRYQKIDRINKEQSQDV